MLFLQDAEKGRRGKRDSSGTMSTAIWSSEDVDVVDDATCMAAISPPVDCDSGIDRVIFFQIDSGSLGGKEQQGLANYSECPKSKRPKMGKRRNLIF